MLPEEKREKNTHTKEERVWPHMSAHHLPPESQPQPYPSSYLVLQIHFVVLRSSLVNSIKLQRCQPFTEKFCSVQRQPSSVQDSGDHSGHEEIGCSSSQPMYLSISELELAWPELAA